LEVRTKPLILVVDDQATIIRIMTSILQPTYDVCVATSGKKALEVARTQRQRLFLEKIASNEVTDLSEIRQTAQLLLE
jgi:CheY-like chemotaxis protein